MRSLLVTILLLWAVGPGFGQDLVGTCEPGNAEDFLDVGNVRARIVNTGGFWWRGSPSVYEVPKGGGANALFAASFWIGGLVEGELRMASARFGLPEFWPGPLDDEGNPPDDCVEFDRVYSVYRRDLVDFEQSGTATEDLADWPTGLGAPTLDAEGHLIDLSDVLFSERRNRRIDLAAGERPAMIGDQMVWYVLNDRGNHHLNSEVSPIGLEMHVTAFAFDAASPAGDATFYRHRLLYRGAAPMREAYVAVFADGDLGNFSDDFAGVDTALGLGFFYNADDVDDGSRGYGARPPAVGIDWLRGPAVPGGVSDTAWVSGERVDGFTNRSTTAFNWIMPCPGFCERFLAGRHFYGMMRGLWDTGEVITEGRDGIGTSTDTTTFAFPGDPVTGAFWSEMNLDGRGTPSTPSDRRFVISSGPFEMEPGGEQEVIWGVLWARGSDHLDSITELRHRSRLMQGIADGGFRLARRTAAPPPGTAAGRRSVLLEMPGLVDTRIGNGDKFGSQPWHGIKYTVDAEDNRIPDYSFAGYKKGEEGIPPVPVRHTLSRFPGDQAPRIQAALDGMTQYEKDDNGFRGALVLEPGRWQIGSTIRMSVDGVVLRGGGDGENGTIIEADWTDQDTPVLIMGGHHLSTWRNYVEAGTRQDIAAARLPLGSTVIPVTDASSFNHGDRVILEHECTDQWLENVDHGGADGLWDCDDNISQIRDIMYVREIVARDLEANTVSIDIPLFNHFDQTSAGSGQPSTIYRLSGSAPTVSNLVLEDVRIDIQYDESEVDELGRPVDMDHARDAIVLDWASDVYIRNTTVLHFSRAGIDSRVADRVTIENVKAVEPVGQITGGLRYNFAVGGWSQQFLFVDTYANKGRHSYIVNGNGSTSGIVFLRTIADATAQSGVESHRDWAQGVLVDGHRDINALPNTFPLIRLGDSKGIWGWSAVHSVAWNVNTGNRGLDSAEVLVQSPPTAQNYVVGYSSNVTNTYAGVTHPIGFVDGSAGDVFEPESLYEAQLRDRGYSPRRQVFYLSDMDWSSVTPGCCGPIRKDLSTSGNPLRLNRVTYRKGLGTHATSTIVYNLGLAHAYDRFKSEVGLDDFTDGVTGHKATAVFKVFLDGALAYTSGLMHGHDKTKRVDLNVAGVNELKLVVEDGGVAQRGNHANWAAARLESPSTWPSLPKPPSDVVWGTEDDPRVPTSLKLGSSFPNPSSTIATTTVGLPRDSHVEIDVYDVLGRHRIRAFSGRLSAGYQIVHLPVASLDPGVYFYCVSADGGQIARSMVVR